MSNERTHTTCPTIADQLESTRCLWSDKVKGVGTLTAYATKSGVVIFLDFFPDAHGRQGGWTMLTESPGNSIAADAEELSSMISGTATSRARVEN
jgi:hypothetical protein